MSAPTTHRFSDPRGPMAAWHAARLWRTCMDEARKQGSVEARAVADLLSGLVKFLRQYEPDQTLVDYCFAELLEVTAKRCSTATDTVFVETISNYLQREES